MSFVVLLVLSILWGGVVAVAAAGIQRLGLSGRTRQMMWRCASIMLLAPFPVALIYACMGPGTIDPIWNYGEGQAPSIPIVLEEMPAQTGVAVQEVSQGVSFEFDLMTAAIVFLSLGWMFRACRARWANKELKRITDKSDPVQSYAVLSSAEFWNKRLGLTRRTSFRLLPGDYSPFTQGVLKPVVYLPHGLERELSQEEMALVVGHELMHIRRLDAVWRPMERIVADVLWFNPFAWLVRAELDRAREIACDEAMLVSKAPPTVYARALVAAARFAEGLPTRAPAAAMFPFNKDKELTERVKIAVANSQGNSSLVGLAAFGVFLLAGLPLAAAQGAGGEKLRAPLPEFEATVIKSEKAKITSGFGIRKHPISKEMKDHAGIDIADKIGTKIHTPSHGLVTFAGYKEGYGNVVQINYNPEWMGRFGQLSKILVEVGQSVQAGDVIGLLGESGNATGPHLHIEVYGPAPDFVRSGHKVAYDPEQLGVALIPALELRAKQIRDLGVVLPKSLAQPIAADSASALVAPSAPTALVAPKAPLAPNAPKVTGITYLDDGRVQILDAGVVVIEFDPSKDDFIPRHIVSKDGVSNKRKYTYEDANGDSVKIIAGTSDIPPSKLGIWVNGDKISNAAEWNEWRHEIQNYFEKDMNDFKADMREQAQDMRDREREEKADMRERAQDMRDRQREDREFVEMLEGGLEKRIEAQADAYEVEVDRWTDSLEAQVEELAARFERSAESSRHAANLKAQAQAQARANARSSAEALAMSSRAFAQDWTAVRQEQIAKTQIVALEQVLVELDEKVLSISEQCEQIENSEEVDAKYKLVGLKTAKSALQEARTQVAEQLVEAQKAFH